jgi:hypothetical protein
MIPLEKIFFIIMWCLLAFPDHIENMALALSVNDDGDPGARFAPQQIVVNILMSHSLAQRNLVYLHDYIIGPDAGPVRGALINAMYHIGCFIADFALPGGHLNAQTTVSSITGTAQHGKRKYYTYEGLLHEGAFFVTA